MPKSRIILAFFLLGGINSLEAQDLNRLEKDWGLSPLRQKLQHKAERPSLKTLRDQSKLLEIPMWYEDGAINKGATPSPDIYCKLAHSLIYGRNRLRSSEGRIPIQSAFQNHKDIRVIKGVFFAVTYKNIPYPPKWDSEAKTPKRLRVKWTRQEKVIPYLTMTINRKQWRGLNRQLKSHGNLSFEQFREGYCGAVLKQAPTLRADFENLKTEILGINPKKEKSDVVTE